MKQDSAGLFPVTVVSGSSFTGLFAMDGSVNVVDATNESGYVGLYHACGALNVTLISDSAVRTVCAANGSLNVIEGGTISGFAIAFRALSDEVEGLAFDFTDASAQIKDTGTPANNYSSVGRVANGELAGPGGLITYTSPSPKLCRQSDGLYKYQAHNLYLNSATPANQAITVVSGATYAVTLTGSVTMTASGAATGTWTAGTTTFTAATTTLTLGSTSGSGTVHVRRTPSNSDYIETTSAAVYDLPYGYDTSGNGLGLRVEEARTNRVTYNRDATQSSWVKNDITAAKTATGVDGVANSASTLTATATGPSRGYLTASVSDDAVSSVYLRRRTGTGEVAFGPFAGVAGTGSETTTGSSISVTWSPSVGSPTFTGTDPYTYSNLTVSDYVSGLATLTPGRTYRLSFTLSGHSGGTMSVSALTQGSNPGIRVSEDGTYHLIFMAVNETTSIWIRANGASDCSGTMSSVSLYEVSSIDYRRTLTTDWQRFTFDCPVGPSNTFHSNGVWIGTDGDEVDVDLLQVEVGSTASSPIETYASTVERSPDIIETDPALLPYDYEFGTFLIVGQTDAGTSATHYFGTIYGPSGSDFVTLYQSLTGGRPYASMRTTADGLTLNATNFGDIRGVYTKLGVAWEDDVGAYSSINGANLAAEGTSVKAPQSPTKLVIGGYNGTSFSVFQGYIEQIIYLPRRVDQAALNTLTGV